MTSGHAGTDECARCQQTYAATSQMIIRRHVRSQSRDSQSNVAWYGTAVTFQGETQCGRWTYADQGWARSVTQQVDRHCRHGQGQRAQPRLRLRPHDGRIHGRQADKHAELGEERPRQERVQVQSPERQGEEGEHLQTRSTSQPGLLHGRRLTSAEEYFRTRSAFSVRAASSSSATSTLVDAARSAWSMNGSTLSLSTAWATSRAGLVAFAILFRMAPPMYVPTMPASAAHTPNAVWAIRHTSGSETESSDAYRWTPATAIRRHLPRGTHRLQRWRVISNRLQEQP